MRFQDWRTVMLAGIAAAVAAALFGACSSEESGDDDAAFDQYARDVCTAISRLSRTLQPQMTPGSGPPRDAMISAWDGFIDNLEEARPPDSLKDYHEEWLEMQRDDLDAFRSGKPTYYDPLDHAPDLDQDLQNRVSAAFQRVPECRFEPTPPATVQPTAGPSATAAPQPTAATAIDYASPTKYLQAGTQSRLTEPNLAVVRTEVSSASDQFRQAGAAAEWVRTAFRVEPAGGATIGNTDVNTLMRTRVITGCHDSALVLSTVLRSFGIPAIMVDTASVQWAEDFNAGKAAGDTGHVFVEAYIDGRWRLIECGAGIYASDYDPANPLIISPSMPDAKGYYVLAKGPDPAGYGVTSGSALHERFLAFAKSLPALKLHPPAYQWQSLPH